MVYRITLVSRAERAVPKLLLVAVLILVLSGCGGAPSGEENTGDEETTSPEAAGEETTSGPARREGTVPPDILSATLGFPPGQGSGVSGTAVLADVSDGMRVTLNMENLADQRGTEHIAHLHEGGTCADKVEDNSPAARYFLDPVVTDEGGNGASTTTIPDVTVAQLFSGTPKYVDVHAEATGDEMPPSLSCADIYTTTGGD